MLNHTSGKLFLAGAAAIWLLLLSSCQGRKESNMVPTGDTVEVVIMAPDTVEQTADMSYR